MQRKRLLSVADPTSLTSSSVKEAIITDKAKNESSLWEQVYSIENLNSALEKILENYPSPGIDGKSVDQITEGDIAKIQTQLKNHIYFPSKTRPGKVEKNGKSRVVDIHTAHDYLVLTAISLVISENITFSPNSYCKKGEGPYRAARIIANRVKKIHEEGKKVYLLKCDISKCFPSIRSSQVQAEIDKIGDKNLTKLVMNMIGRRKDGVSTGSPLSPIILELIMKKIDAKFPSYMRYVDDTCDVALSRNQAKSKEKKISKRIQSLGWGLGANKTAIRCLHHPSERFELLGFKIDGRGRVLAPLSNIFPTLILSFLTEGFDSMCIKSLTFLNFYKNANNHKQLEMEVERDVEVLAEIRRLIKDGIIEINDHLVEFIVKAKDCFIMSQDSGNPMSRLKRKIKKLKNEMILEDSGHSATTK